MWPKTTLLVWPRDAKRLDTAGYRVMLGLQSVVPRVFTAG